MTRRYSRIARIFTSLPLRDRVPLRSTRLLFLAVAVAAFSTVFTPFPITGTVPAAAAQSRGVADPQRLVGRWVRPDGGYVLELSDIKTDGSLKAAYYNPRPINVSRAELSRKKGRMSIFIELRDVNYPGSNYNLRYDPATDRLTGTYFQAVERQRYEVEFVRAE